MNQPGPALGVAVLAVVEVLIHYGREGGIREHARGEAVEKRRKTGNCRREDQPPSTNGASRLAERTDSVLACREVVQGAEQQDSVERRVLDGQAAGVAALGADSQAVRRESACLIDVAGDRVDDYAPHGPAAASHSACTPVPPPTSRILKGVDGRWRAITSLVRSSSSCPSPPTIRLASSYSCS